MTGALVTFSNVSKTFDERLVIDSMSFEIQEGSAFALLGPNGAGKTTTIRLLTGLLSPDCGDISLFGSRLHRENAPMLRSSIGVQNDGNLYEELTVEENLNLWGKLYGLESSVVRERINELLSLFELTDRRRSKASQLSKGMRQKVMIARAIIHHPRLLILDEPITGLDPQSAETLLGYLKVLTERDGMTILFSTHILEGLEKLATHVGILDRGRCWQLAEFMIYWNVDGLLPSTVYRATIIKKSIKSVAAMVPVGRMLRIMVLGLSLSQILSRYLI